MSGHQLSLLPTAAPELRRESIPLERIDGYTEAAPSAKLRELIGELGLLQPVVVTATGGRYRLVEGRRRCKAIALLAAEGEWPAPPRVDALVIDGEEASRTEVQGGLTLALHASRSASPASELAAIEAILEAERIADETATVKEIASQTGISVQTVRRRLRLRSLTPGLRAAFDEGRIAASVAEAAARLSKARQQGLEGQLDDGARLTLGAVRDAARAQTSTVAADLPDGLFEDHDIAWQTTVRGHLVAALQAIPHGEQHAPLVNIVAEALAKAEQV